ncbi:MAG: polyamine aminopropyltransferase [Armatimonadetes bacterium]|nr:polyamine aminopropyltransferase [Armatimonadota bacterium]
MRLTFPIRSDKLTLTVETSAHLCSVRSEYQQIDVYDSEVFGRILLLDGHVQLSTFDERAYHEALVWVPLLNIASPKRALVVGGGDGGVLRELCRHPGIEHIDMVEIDGAVVQVSMEHLPSVSDGAFEDARVSLHLADAFSFVKETSHQYDLIVVDCTDVYEEEEGELSEMLFTDVFYADVLRALAPGGFVVTQADNPVFCPYSLEEVLELYKQVFAETGSYWAPVPSFGGYSAFVWGSNGARLQLQMPSSPARLQHLSDSSYGAWLEPLRFNPNL